MTKFYDHDDYLNPHPEWTRNKSEQRLADREQTIGEMKSVLRWHRYSMQTGCDCGEKNIGCWLDWTEHMSKF